MHRRSRALALVVAAQTLCTLPADAGHRECVRRLWRDMGVGAVRVAGNRADYAECMAKLGIACAAQCGGNTTCQAACVANNAWRCNR
jgi:hypothetical protein